MANPMQYAIGRPDGDSNTRGDFRVPTAAVSTASRTGYPAANVMNEHIARSWRSTGTSSTWVGVDLGSSVSVAAILVEGLNMDTFNIRLGASATVNSNAVFGDGAKSSISVNPRTKRYSALAVGSGSGRYAGVSLNGSTTDGSSDHEVGRITVIATLRTLARNWSTPYRYEARSKGSSLELPGGQIQTASTSDLYLTINVVGRFDIDNANEVADGNRFASARDVDRILHFENRTSDTDNIHAYLTKLDDTVAITERFPTLSLDIQLREII